MSKKLLRNRYPAGSQRIAVNEASPDKTLHINTREPVSNVRSRFFMTGAAYHWFAVDYDTDLAGYSLLGGGLSQETTGLWHRLKSMGGIHTLKAY